MHVIHIVTSMQIGEGDDCGGGAPLQLQNPRIAKPLSSTSAGADDPTLSECIPPYPYSSYVWSKLQSGQ